MQDIRKKHSNLKSDFPISREITPRNGTSISHGEFESSGERRPRFVRSEDISVYKNPMGRIESESEYNNSGDAGYREGRQAGRSWRKIKTIGSYTLLFTFIFGIYYALTYVFDSATITVVPNYKDLSLAATPVTLGEKADIPFEIATTALTKSKTLPKTTTTTVEKKASGQITIYNNYKAEPQRLVKFTRFESTAKKIYKIQDSIVVPAKKGDTPGEITVKVVAESEGPGYNTLSDTFTIPGFKGKDQYTKMYAKTAGPISGGSSGSKAIVALTDLNAAKDEVAVALRDSAKKEFAAKKWDKKIPLVESVSVTTEDNGKEVMQGDADTYNAKAIGSIAVIDQSNLSKFALGGDVNKNLNYSFLPSKNFSILINKDSSLASSTLEATISGNARVVWLTDYAGLRDKLVGKTRKDFTTLITNNKTISSATISIFPPWKTDFPKRKDAVTVKEKLPDYKL